MTTPHPFAGRVTRVLSVPEVRSLMSMDEAMAGQRQAFIAHAASRTVASPNAWLRLPGDRRGWLKLLSGYEDDSNALGVKILARFPQNPPGANLGSLVILFDAGNGFPLAIMDGTYITAMRTGIGAGLATEALAAPDATDVGLVGTGVVAWYSLLAVARTMPTLKTVRVFSRSAQRRADLAGRIGAELGLAAQPVDDVGDAVRNAQVVITATNSASPVLLAEYVEPGQHINAMGIKTELAPEVMGKAYVIPDGRREAIADGKVAAALAAGVLTQDEIGDDLGIVLATPGNRHQPGRTTVFDSSGIAIQDVAMARDLFRAAEQRDVGTCIDFGLTVGTL